MTTLDVRFGGRLDTAGWARRHAAGEVPDRWPYGLDRLAKQGFTLVERPAAVAPGRLARGLRAAGGYEWWEARQYDRTPSDLVACWDERVGVPAAGRTGRGRPPVATGVIWLTDRTRYAAAHRALAGRALRRAHRVWALSSAQLPLLRDALRVPATRLRHLLFGIDADFFTPDGTDPVPGLVVSVGNDRHRDHGLVVAATAMVAQKHPDARLELATRSTVEVPAVFGVRHEHRSHVELRDLYRRASVVAVALHPNLHVSGVTVALEAMAVGRPVVITGTPGMSDYVSDGQTGVLVPPGDPYAFATAVSDLLSDPARAAALGQAGRIAVAERLNTAAQAERLADLLRD